ncbi:MAG TPA: HYR domain-containing protein [Anaerolineales bacterium]|nr:HYR domain-containing protein [Anaerolineales bacterium]
MTAKKHPSILTIFLIVVVCANLFNVRSVLADGEPPTEPPAATQVETEAPPEATPAPVQSTPEPVEVTAEATATPAAEALTQVPESTQVVVVDESGNSVPLATQEAAEITKATDPIWCPDGVLPGGAGCSTSYSTISDLINNMVSNTSSYTQNGVIYFTANPGSGNFNLTTTTLTTDFDTLKNYNLTLQGGWNGNTASPSFSGQTDFGSNPITIGTDTDRWVGNVTLNDIVFCNDPSTCSGISQTALTVYTSAGNITLSNVDVNNQGNGKNTALLDTNSGDITVAGGSFDGNGTPTGGNSAGFSARTGSGSITISDSSFTDNKKPGPPNTFDGATLSAPVVTLNNVTATNNDGNGITVNNANVVTLNNVLASGNGTDITPTGFSGNFGSGVFVNGNAGSRLIIIGGIFNNNQRYGVEVGDPANTTIYIQSNPTCTGNDSNAAPINNCYNDTTIFDNTAPVITPTVSGTLGSNGWYTSSVSISWSVTDAESDILSSNGCAATNLSTETVGAVSTCSATNNAGLSNSVSVTIKIDQTAPTLILPANITTEAIGPTGALVNYSASASDNLDATVSASCSPASGSTFGLGTTTVNCSTSDAAGHTTSGSFQVTVQDTTAPTLNLPANITVSTSAASVVVTYSASASDLVDGPVSVTCVPLSGSSFPVGSTTVNCSAADAHGNTGNGSFIVNVLDGDGPAITVPANITAEAIDASGAAVSYSASATDVVDGSVAVSCSPVSGSTFPLGTTTVNCSATDSSANTNSAAFLVTVQDTTAPTITSTANLSVQTNSASGIAVNYTDPVTSDAVDGAGTASCSPVSGSLFPVGNTTVICTATDAHGNSAISTFVVHVALQGSSSGGNPSIPGSSDSGPTLPELLIPLTGGEAINLDCSTTFWAFGIKLAFINLCDHQTVLNSVGANNLPSKLPDGLTFVMGLDMSILSDNQILSDLPDGTGVQMNFPISGGSTDKFAVLYWNGSQWLEISQRIGSDQLSQILSTNSGNEFFQVQAAGNSFYQVLTTDKTGIFVLVKK